MPALQPGKRHAAPMEPLTVRRPNSPSAEVDTQLRATSALPRELREVVIEVR